MTYTPPEQPAQGGYQPYQSSSSPSYGSSYGSGYGAPASTSKKLSMWGLILGISSIVIPLFLNAIAGGVLAGMGLAKEPAGKTMAIWGIVTSALGFIWAIAFWFAVVPLIFIAALAASVGTYSP